MRIHLVAMMMVLTAVVSTGCDSAREVSDNGRAEARGCNHCHGYPPPPSISSSEAVHPVGVTAASCYLCHPSTVLDATGYTIRVPADPTEKPTHKNGQVEVVEKWWAPDCAGCHDSPPDTGRHAFHVNRGIACATCHDGYVVGDAATRDADADLHMNGSPDVRLANGTVIETANLADKSWPDAECAACHSALDD